MQCSGPVTSVVGTMSYGKTSGDFNTSVDELANLMNDTFTCCMRNYEALLPYFEKRETKPKIYHKLVHINMLLNKLNEELVALRVEYVTVSSYQQKREIVLSEGSRKRKMSDVFEVAKQEIKSIKTEVPFSSSAKCCVATTSGAGINMEPHNSVSMGTEETRYTEVQKSGLHWAKNIKSELHDSDVVEDLLVDPINNSEVPAVQTCDYIASDMHRVSVAGRLVGGNTHDKPADTITHNEESIPLQKIKSKSCIEEKNEDYAHILSKDHNIYGALGGKDSCSTSFSCQTNRCLNRNESPVAFTTSCRETDLLLQGKLSTCNKEKKHTPNFSVRREKGKLPVQISKELCDAENEHYGIIRFKSGRYWCTVCERELFDYNSMKGHVKGRKHEKKQKSAKYGYAQVLEVPNNSYKNTKSVSPCPDVSCSLNDTLTIVECRHEVISMRETIRLDDIWKYFDEKFHINKQFFRIHLGEVICYLCNKQIGRNVLCVKKHVSSLSHLHRIKILNKIELKNKSSNTQLHDIPGILKRIIPMNEFSLENKGFICSVCDCFCTNEVVLSHITGLDHSKKVQTSVRMF